MLTTLNSKIACALMALLTSAIAAQPISPLQSEAAPAGLLRLRAATKAGEAGPLGADKFSVDDLSPQNRSGASKVKKDDVDVLLLEAGGEWSRPLRGSANDVTFVSFQLYVSHATTIDIGGVRLGITTGPIPGSFQLAVDESSTATPQWRALNSHVGADQFGGKLMAMLPTFTVRLDPAAGVYDVFSDSRLLAGSLPLVARSNSSRHFTVRAGSQGAWLSGLVMSDENPLYEDDNANGIDDRFEREALGSVLGAGATLVERQRIAAQWKQSARMRAPPALFVKRPLPDGTVSSTARAK